MQIRDKLGQLLKSKETDANGMVLKLMPGIPAKWLRAVSSKAKSMTFQAIDAYRLVPSCVPCQLDKAKSALIQVFELLEMRVVQERVLLIAHVVSGCCLVRLALLFVWFLF